VGGSADQESERAFFSKTVEAVVFRSDKYCGQLHPSFAVQLLAWGVTGYGGVCGAVGGNRACGRHGCDVPVCVGTTPKQVVFRGIRCVFFPIDAGGLLHLVLGRKPLLFLSEIKNKKI